MRLTRVTDDLHDPMHRLAVENDDDLITIADEDISSLAASSPTTGIRAALDLNHEEAMWLHSTLGKMLRVRSSVVVSEILAYVGEHPGCSYADIERNCGYGAAKRLHAMARDARIHRRHRRPDGRGWGWRYWVPGTMPSTDVQSTSEAAE